MKPMPQIYTLIMQKILAHDDREKHTYAGEWLPLSPEKNNSHTP